jgi:hypothetical protein
MAFDMYAGSRYEKIEHEEEFVFSLITESEEFIHLNNIWDNFYNGPKIEYQNANKIVHELITLKSKVLSKNEHRIIDRWLIFFSYSYTQEKDIRCASD